MTDIQARIDRVMELDKKRTPGKYIATPYGIRLNDESGITVCSGCYTKNPMAEMYFMAAVPEMVSIIKELQAQLSAKDDHLNFIWRWVERGKWDKNTGLKTAIDILAHYDAAPWYGNRKEWDTTHKEYDKEITEFVSDRAKLAEKDALIAELQMENEWHKTTDCLPEKPSKADYEQIDCLVIHKGEIKHLVWNCEHLVWDDETGDDFYCYPTESSHWRFYPEPPEGI